MSTGKVLSRREYKNKKGKTHGRKKIIRTVVLCVIILSISIPIIIILLKSFYPE